MMLPPQSHLLYTSDEFFRGRSKPAQSAEEAGKGQLQRRRVLVVDDQKLIADSLTEILHLAGFEAIAAYDGWHALEIAPRFHPQWLLSDVLMPRMNGVELAITIRQKYPEVAILLFSGQAGISEILQDGQGRGYEFELIAKPVHPLRLIERLKEPN
ncbi:MAG TPA: response regulator [Terracidiphilus sp.]|jgi:CheY-like chemotaxis protein|nr:response regulator [Terracidiphilus sp.]